MKTKSQTTARAKNPRAKTFQGAKVMHGLGMNHDELDVFTEQKAMDSFDAARTIWIVVADSALEDLDAPAEISGFSDKQDAIRFAQARANGNIDHRVLEVTNQVLVVATHNKL